MRGQDKPVPIKDFVEFYDRWPKLRPQIMALMNDGDLAQSDADIIAWMIEVMDRVGPNDFASADPDPK